MTDAYLRRLDATLIGPRRARRDLLREVADHLEDATEAYVAAGYDASAAAVLARRDFGTVAEVAAGLQTTLGVAAARRALVLFVLACLPQAFLWDGGLGLAKGAHSAAPDSAVYRLLDLVIERGGFVALLVAVAGLVVTGVGQRWVRPGPRLLRAVSASTLAAAVLVVATGVSMTAMSSGAAPLLWLELALLMVAPLVCVARSAHAAYAAA
jgi:hypothetical protein